MSIFCYNLEDTTKISTLADLKILISTVCKQVPCSLYAAMNYETQCVALRLCCDSDITSLVQICNQKPVSILYTPRPYDFPQPFRGFEQVPLRSSNEADFTIISAEGPEDGTQVTKNQKLEKVWKVKISGNCENPEFRCVEGDYFGVLGMVELGNEFVVLRAQVVLAPVAGWSSSTWRLFTFGVPFGPALWIEVLVD